MESIMHVDNDRIIREALHENLYTHIVILRLILNMDKSSKFFNDLNEIDTSLVKTDVLNLSVIELLRLNMIAKFLQETHSKRASLDVSKSYLITQLPQIFKMDYYEETFNLLNNNHNMNLMQRQNIQGIVNLNTKTEMQLFNEYMIVRMYLSNIFRENSGSVDGHLSHIRCLLKTINDGNVLFRLLQTVFTLVFLRFDHVRKTKSKKYNYNHQLTLIENNFFFK